MSDSKLMEAFKKKWIGKKVRIIGDHPHTGTVGEVIDIEHTAVGLGMKIEGEWNSFFVFSGENVQVIKG